MPQELHIVNCFKCQTYQVDIIKKAKKWCCKICGEKQTLKQVFGRGSGTECRKRVQELNMKKQEFDQMTHSVVQKIVNHEIAMPDFLFDHNHPKERTFETKQNITDVVPVTKWEKYVDAPEPEEDTDNKNLLLQLQPQANNCFNHNRVYKRKCYTSEHTEFQDKQPKDQSPAQTTTLLNWNKKSKFESHTSNELAQDIEVQSEIKPKPSAPILVNPNSKWTNFLHNSGEEE